MFLKLRNLLLASPALVGMVMLNSGSAIAIESPWGQLNGNSGDIGLTTRLDASDAETFDLLPAEEATFTFQTDTGATDVATTISWCPLFFPLCY